MRITGGTARGRRLRAPRSSKVRPTADKVRGAIFNLLAARYEIGDQRVLDLFAGSGALGLDALSRGARSVTFIDESREACRTMHENLERSGFSARAEVRRMTLPEGIRRLVDRMEPFDGILLDPPYRRGLAHSVLRALGGGDLLVSGAWVIVEHAREDELAESYGVLRRSDSRRYGSTAISVYEKVEAE